MTPLIDFSRFVPIIVQKNPQCGGTRLRLNFAKSLIGSGLVKPSTTWSLLEMNLIPRDLSQLILEQHDCLSQYVLSVHETLDLKTNMWHQDFLKRNPKFTKQCFHQNQVSCNICKRHIQPPYWNGTQ